MVSQPGSESTQEILGKALELAAPGPLDTPVRANRARRPRARGRRTITDRATANNRGGAAPTTHEIGRGGWVIPNRARTGTRPSPMVALIALVVGHP